MRRRARAILWPLGGVLAPLIFAFLRLLSRDSLQSLTRITGRAIYLLLPEIRRKGLRNLDLTFGDELSPQRKRWICRTSIENYLGSMLDLFYFAHRPRAEFRQAVFPGWEERFQQATRGGGALIITAHCGSMELLCSAISQFGRAAGQPGQSFALTRNLKLFERFAASYRRRLGSDVIHDKRTTARQLSAMVSRGHFLFTVMDRNRRQSKGLIVDFMGQPAFTPYHAVNIALHGGVPVIGAFLIPEGNRFRMHIEEPVEVRDLGGKEKTYRHYLRIFNEQLERIVRLHPERWLWAQDRWGRPRGTVRFAEPADSAAHVKKR